MLPSGREDCREDPLLSEEPTGYPGSPEKLLQALASPTAHPLVSATGVHTSSTQNGSSRDISLLKLASDISQGPGSQKGTGNMSDLYHVPRELCAAQNSDTYTAPWCRNRGLGRAVKDCVCNTEPRGL